MKLSNIAANINRTDDLDTLLKIEKHLNSCASLIKLYKHSNTMEPANKRIQPQRNFFPTKRKRKNTKVRIAKPSISEKDHIINRLLLDTSHQYKTDIGMLHKHLTSHTGEREKG